MIAPAVRFLIAAAVLSVATLSRATTFDLSSASIADIDAAFAAGALTSERLVELCLARIKAYDQTGPRINAVISNTDLFPHSFYPLI